MSGDLFSRPDRPLLDPQAADSVAPPDGAAPRPISRTIVPEERDLLRDAEPILPPGALNPEALDAIGSALRRPTARRVAPPPEALVPDEASPEALLPRDFDTVEQAFFRPEPPQPRPRPVVGSELEEAFRADVRPSESPDVVAPPPPDEDAERDELARSLQAGVPRRATPDAVGNDRVTYRPVSAARRKAPGARGALWVVAFLALVGVGAGGAWIVRRGSAAAEQQPPASAPDLGSAGPTASDASVTVAPAAVAPVPVVPVTVAPAAGAVAAEIAEVPSAPAAAPVSTEVAPAAVLPVASSARAVMEARAAAERLPPDQGLLQVVSDRPGQVYIDDRPVGDVATLGNVALLAGMHRVRVVSPGSTREIEARVDAGQVRAIEFRFSR